MPNGEQLAAEQALKDDSVPYENGDDEIEILDPNSPIHSRKGLIRFFGNHLIRSSKWNLLDSRNHYPDT